MLLLLLAMLRLLLLLCMLLLLRLLLLLNICLPLPGKMLLVGDSCEKIMRFEKFGIILADTLFFHLLKLLERRQ